MKRRYSREYALEVLYANELNPQTEKINSEIYKKLSDSGKQFAESLINSVRENNEEIVDLSCNCPYADSGNNCKHIAAVLFYLEDKENALARQDMEEDIYKLVEEADTLQLKNF